MATAMGSLRKAKDHPWLALPHQYYLKPGKSRCFMRFQSVSSNRVYHCQLPAAASGSSTICGSSPGFLIMVDETTSQITMIDRLSKAWFKLPPISTSLAPQCSSTDSGRDRQKYFVHKAVLSSLPDCNPYDYILMVIYGEERELAYYNVRSQTWTNLQAVIRFLKDETDVGYETYKFELHLLESYEEWRHIGGIEDWALFLGRNQSVAVPTQVFKGLKGNNIYFTDDNLEPYKYGGSVIGGYDFGVFDMGEFSAIAML
ncbi:hypothetical protein REPUB_Repub01dG0049100 [Reevesia pubescens]